MDSAEALYEAHKHAVYRLALSYVGQVQDAEDVTQSVFLKLLRYRPGILPGKERNWLLKVTANECKNLVRQKKYLSPEPVPELSFETPEDSGLFEAVQSLRPEYRTVIYLYYYEGYSTKEIGKILGLRQSCVTTRLSRARLMLKTELEGAI